MYSCFPHPSPSDPKFVAATHLEELPELSISEAKFLDKVVQRLHYDRFGTEKEDNPLNEESPTCEIQDDESLNFFESVTFETDEEPVISTDISSDQNACMSNNARPPSKRQASASDDDSDRKKPFTQIPNKVTIIGRITPKKPPKDDKQYRIIILSNGLQAVLIKSPGTSGKRKGGQSIDVLDSLSDALKEHKKNQKQKCLPNDFPLTLPLLNQPLSNVVCQVIRKKFEAFVLDSVGGDNTLPMNSAGKLSNDGVPQSTIAIVVNVGTCDDPIECQGLAHFTEHMVHYGSEKYPGEETYFSFAMNHDYDFNAFTENHTTTYYATVPLNCTSKSMERMVNMLSKPLFEKNMTTREVNAVDSEFHLSRHFDILRRRFLFQYAIKGHPLANFDCGNKETLLAGTNIHKTIRDFHSKYYVASSMTVGLESTLPFSVQEKLVLENFSDLPPGDRKLFRETPPEEKEKKIVGERFNMDYVFQGLSSISNLWIVFPIPKEFAKNHGSMSLSFVLNMLGDDRVGSLANYLKKQEYIWLMLCNKYHPYNDPSLTDNKYTAFVAIDFFLTPLGESNVENIMNSVFYFINDLQRTIDVQLLQLFNEMKLRGDQNYRLFEGDEPLNLAKELQRVDPENILKNEYWLWKDAVFRPDEIREILRQLKPTNMIVIQTLPSTTKLRDYLKVKKVSQAPFSGAEFVAQAIRKRFRCLENKQYSSNALYNFSIIKDTSVAQVSPKTLQIVHHGEIQPQLLKLRNQFGVKVAYAVHEGNTVDNYQKVVLINYINSEVKSTVRNFAMSLLWATAVSLSFLNELRNDLSHTSIIVMVHDHGITLGLLGYTEKFLQEIEALNGEFFTKPINEASYLMARATILAIYDLMFASNADHATMELMHFMTCDHSGDVHSDAIVHIREQSISLKEVNNFAIAFKAKTLAMVVAGGNVSIQEANQVIDLVNKQDRKYASLFLPVPIVRLAFSEYTLPKSCHEYMTPISPGEACVRVKSDYDYGYTTTVSNFYFVGNYDPAHYHLWWNSLYFFNLRAFVTLRMKQQLGYHVQGYFPRPRKHRPMVIGVSVTSTASNFSPCELDNYIDDFMVSYGKYLDTVDEKTFEQLKKERQRKRNIDPRILKIKLKDARAWYQQHFGETFLSKDPLKYHYLGISKISVQVLGNGHVPCHCCEKCREISGWRRGEFLNHFQFAQAKQNGPYKNYFIDDPKKMREIR